MGIFSFFGTMKSKVEASIVIQNLLLMRLKTTEQSHPLHNDLYISLFTALSELEVNHSFYPLHNMDYKFLKMLAPVIEAIKLDWEEEHGELINQLHSGYIQWLKDTGTGNDA